MAENPIFQTTFGSAGYWIGLLFDPEDGSDLFLRNVRLSPHSLEDRTLRYLSKTKQNS
jgi:hypothetical protein